MKTAPRNVINRRSNRIVTMMVLAAASGLLQAAAPPVPPHPGSPIQGPAWVTMVIRPPFSHTLPYFCATNVGSHSLSVYMVVHNTSLAASVGTITSQIQTLQSLQTLCLPLPAPNSLANGWLFGVTIANDPNAATVLTELQSLVVSAQFLPSTADSEGIILTPMLFPSVALPGNNAP